MAAFDECDNLDIFTYTSISHDDLLEALKLAATFSIQVETLRVRALLSPDELKQRQALADYLEKVLRTKGIKGKIQLFGSSANRLGFKDADVDMFFDLPNVSAEADLADREVVFKKLNLIRGVLEKAFGLVIWKPVKARIPIVQVI